MNITLPASIQDDIILAYALANGYQQTVSAPETLTYDAQGNPVQVPASSGPNPQSASDFVSALIANQMIQVYQQAEIAAAVAAATEQATQTVQANIATAVQAQQSLKVTHA